MISKQDLEQQLKQAIRNQDKVRLSVLRLLLSAIHNREIDKRAELTKEELALIIKKEAKNRRESVEVYRQANRIDLLEKEEEELAILGEFTPPDWSEKQVRQLVKEAINKHGFSSQSPFGEVMSQVMNQIKGQADGSLVAKVVKEELN